MILLKIFAVVIAILLFSLYVYLKKSFKYWKHKNVYSETPTVPFGNAGPLLLHKDDTASFFKKIYLECKMKSLRFCGFYMFSTPMLIVSDLNLIRAILKTDFNYFEERVYHSSETDPLSLHLGTLKGAEWKSMRNKLSPAFTPTRIKLMFETISRCTKEFVLELNEFAARGEKVEIKDISSRYSMDVLVNCVFGIDGKSVRNPNEDYVAISKSYFRLSLVKNIVGLLTFINSNLLSLLDIKITETDVEQYFLKTVNAVVKDRETNDIIKKDFMHTLIQVRNNVVLEGNETRSVNNPNNTKLSLTIENIAAECLVFFMAGFESSSTAITFCLYELAINIRYQKMIREEVEKMLQKHHGEFNYDFVTDLTFTQQCIKETLRKHPPLPIITRKCTKNYTIPNSDVAIEKDTVVVIPIVGVHNDPTIYTEVDKFEPERYSEENCAKRDPLSYLVFGYGPRNCLAYKFGFLKAALAISALVYSFEIKLNPSTQVPVPLNKKIFFRRPDVGVFLDFKKIR